MTRSTRWILVVATGAALAVGTAGPALADKGGEPNERSCGGIGREAQAFAAQEGPMDHLALFRAQGPFTCDDVGGEHGQGF
jgi:hypothetical protein